jgi:hypothetical protein
VRLAEDPVRILRAVKFATRLGFRIDDETWDAMCEHSAELSRSAKPRVLEEILRLLRSGTALGAFRMLRACGALAVILPEVDLYLGQRDDPDPKAHDRADQFWRLMEALDAYVHDGHMPSTALCIAVLFLRVIESEADEATRTLPGPPPEDLFEVTGEVLEPFGLSARLPRRDCGNARRLIAVQRRFTQVASKRFRPAMFLHSEEFPEALALFRLRSMAWGQGWDVYEAWVQRYRALQETPGALPPPLEPRKRRRRRRRRSGEGPQDGSDRPGYGGRAGPRKPPRTTRPPRATPSPPAGTTGTSNSRGPQRLLPLDPGPGVDFWCSRCAVLWGSRRARPARRARSKAPRAGGPCTAKAFPGLPVLPVLPVCRCRSCALGAPSTPLSRGPGPGRRDPDPVPGSPEPGPRGSD